MSYEGYSQFLCKEGHYWCSDVYEYDDGSKCPGCGHPAVWSNGVDETNGAEPETGEGYGYVELKEDKPAEYEECFHCKHRKTTRTATYLIPEANRFKNEPRLV